MAEIFLHGLHVVTVLQGEHGEGVVQVVAERICENEPTVGVLLGGVYLVLPKITGL